MFRFIDLRAATFGLLAASFLSGCATSSQQDGAATGPVAVSSSFENLLIIGITEEYEGRSRFERKLASDLRSAGIKATAMYSVAGGNKPITREGVEALVAAEGYDGILISRAIDQDTKMSVRSGSSATKAVRKEGGGLDVFRYDYEELNEPAIVNFSLGATIHTELISAQTEERVWEFESSIPAQEKPGLLIDEASARIVKRLKRDRLL